MEPREHPWFLTAAERGNPATRLRPWTHGNRVDVLVDGRAYFAALADVVEATGPGDHVYVVDWRGDPGQLVRDDGPTVSELLAAAAARGVQVKGLVWRSHLDRLRFSAGANRTLAERVNDAGGEILLDQRVRRMGSHHQKAVVVRHADVPGRDVAFVGGIDLARSRRDSSAHEGDPHRQEFSDRYGPRPAWHDVQVALRGPAVVDVETVFRERWDDPAALSRLPWHAVPDLLRRLDRDASALQPAAPDPPEAGTCAVQLVRTYPPRHLGGYPFAPEGERSAARAYAKALRRARRLIYVEDQYLWSAAVGRVFAAALREQPDLHLVAVLPRFPDHDGAVSTRAAQAARARAIDLLLDAGGDRVVLADVENTHGRPVYVHAKVCVVDDVWAAVGSDNFNLRSWTHDSELTVTVVDEQRDERAPADPAGLGDGARVFARDLRLRLLREHLDLDDDASLLDPDEAVAAVRRSAERLEAWHAGGRRGPRPAGRLRPHVALGLAAPVRLLVSPFVELVLDPDGRPRRLRRSNEF